MKVTNVAFAHVFDQSLYTYVAHGSSSAGRVPTLKSLKIVFSSWTMTLLTQKEGTSSKSSKNYENVSQVQKHLLTGTFLRIIFVNHPSFNCLLSVLFS